MAGTIAQIIERQVGRLVERLARQRVTGRSGSLDSLHNEAGLLDELEANLGKDFADASDRILAQLLARSARQLGARGALGGGIGDVLGATLGTLAVSRLTHTSTQQVESDRSQQAAARYRLSAGQLQAQAYQQLLRANRFN